MGNKLFKISLIFGSLLSIGLIAVFCYSIFFLKLVFVPTGAMSNTIIPGDYLVVKKRAFGPIKRGDVIIFESPQNPSVHFVFRVVGLPRELIEVRGQKIYIDGVELLERRVQVRPDTFMGGPLQEISSEGDGTYKVFYDSNAESLSQGGSETKFAVESPFRIPADSFFVMGDNRDNSYDSRLWGPVPQNLIFGKATMICWSSTVDNLGPKQVRWERVFTNIR